LVDWRKTSPLRLLRGLWIQVVVAAVTVVLLLVLGHWQVGAVLAFAIVAFVATTIVLQLSQGILARMRTARENPLVATGRAVARNRRRYGGQIVHLAIVLILMGITASQARQTEVTVSLAKGETVDVEGYTLAYRDYTYQQLAENGNEQRNEAVLDIYRHGRKLGAAAPERNLWSNVDGSVTEVALRSNLKEDLYIVLASLESNGQAAFQVIITPLVIWLWIGGMVLILGTLIAVWPSRARRAPAIQEIED
jgi:cytochrome c-type biogenesis protein CcmF